MTDALAKVEQFLNGWKPYAELSGTLLAGQIMALLAEQDAEARRRHLLAASDLYRLHERYRELGLYREGRNERAEQFSRLLALDTAAFAAALGTDAQKDHLGLLQYTLEFGRHAVPPRQNLLREFLYKLLELEINDLGMKYSLYPGGVLYSSAGRTHDEMAEDIVRFGMAGMPIAGGTIVRRATLAFAFDMASTAYKSTNDPKAVRDPIARGLHVTGGQGDRVQLKHEPKLA